MDKEKIDIYVNGNYWKEKEINAGKNEWVEVYEPTLLILSGKVLSSKVPLSEGCECLTFKEDIELTNKLKKCGSKSINRVFNVKNKSFFVSKEGIKYEIKIKKVSFRSYLKKENIMDNKEQDNKEQDKREEYTEENYIEGMLDIGYYDPETRIRKNRSE